MISAPELLVKYIRDGLVEQAHFGFVLVSDKTHIIDRNGEPNNYPFYLRSCAKPLQASIIIDYGMDIKYNMTEEEIALCCASHAGEKIHVETAVNLLKKIELDESYLQCGLHKPISKTEQERLLLEGRKENIFQNNCVGKHIMMLALCKMNNWDLASYEDAQHPLQLAIKKRISELCELKKEYPVTKDGCGVPIMSMPLENMAKGYLNLFCNPRYEKIKRAFLNCPYIIGGENRLDTKVIENSGKLIAKVGAGGLCIVVNTETEEALVVKICDCDMKARELVVLDSLKNLHWANIEADHSIKTLHDEQVGEIVTCL
ncbi:putative asparaginase [Brachyspira sp. CAG:484]|nr:putative asparaginase [Brachyspira sp. CAG:484]